MSADSVNSSKTSKSNLALNVVIGALIVAGIFLRFHNITGQDFWHDETITATHFSGHTKVDARNFLSEKPRLFSELVEYGKPLPHEFKRVWDCWVFDQPEKSPLFYMAEYYWSCAFGGDVGTMRLLAILFSLIQLPAFYWFGRELFDSKTTAWIMVALVAVSPALVHYAQEIREYQLFTAATALVSAGYLRAFKTPSTRNWVIYALTLAFSIYTSMLTTFVVAIHFFHMIFHRRYAYLGKFFAACASAVLLFWPWVNINLPHTSYGYLQLQWMSAAKVTMERWLYCVASASWLLFINPAILAGSPLQDPACFLVGLLVIYSVYRVIRSAPEPGKSFLILLVLVSPLPVLVSDLVFGGLRAIVWKYFGYVHVGLFACVAYTLAWHAGWTGSVKKRALWAMGYAALIVCLVSSAYAWTSARISFFRMMSPELPLNVMAEAINRDFDKSPQAVPEHVLVAEEGESYTGAMQMLALSRIVRPEAKLYFYNRLKLESLPPTLTRFFLFNPPEPFVQALDQAGYKTKRIRPDVNFWIVNKIAS